jgi:C-terminal processing protease CtpA/Prc
MTKPFSRTTTGPMPFRSRPRRGSTIPTTVGLAWVCLILFASAGLVRAAGPQVAADLNFEQTEPGREPAAWKLRPLSRSHGYRVQVTDTKPLEGRRCLEIRQPNYQGWGHTGLVTQTVPAEGYRGQRVRFRAAARVEPLTVRGYAALWLREIRPRFRPGHADDMADRPIFAADWTRGQAVIDVAPDAESLEVGFLLNDAGTAWFDDAALEVVGPAGQGNVPPRPLTERGRANLIAFTRLLGYVRYFHPSDQVAALNWDRFAIEAVDLIEGAASADQLAAGLTDLFAPLAPTVQVFPAGKAPPLPEALTRAPADARLVAWRHVGVAGNWMRAFQSARVTDRKLPGAPELALSPEPLGKPGEPFAADLGGGVACRVPLVLFATAEGTLPRPTRKPILRGRPDSFPPTGDDRTTRLADVAIAWNVLQHFYPFFDEVKVDWPAVLRDSLTRAATDPDAAAFQDTLRRLAARLDDGHGVLRGGSGTSPLDGALPLAWDWFEGRLVVVNADPAHAGRVKPGDVVTRIDGRPAARAVEAVEQLVSGATPQFRRYRALMDLRNGPAGSAVSLELQTPGGETYTAKLTRQPADDSPLRGPSLREARLERLVELKPGVWYVDLDRITDGEFEKLVMPRLMKARGAVFDVRGYPALGMQVLTRLADRPLTSELYQNVVTRFPDRRGVVYDGKPWKIGPEQPHLTLKAAFLTDGRAVSYAETFLSLVARHRLGPIVGGPTSGTNGGVNVYVLPGGYRLSFTGQKARKLDGAPHHGVGVAPTHPVARTIRAIAQGRDEVIEKALSLVSDG